MTNFMARLRAREGLAAQALEFAILTAARSGEVLGVRWSEIDLEAKVWTVPPTRIKAGREHRVPLSPPGHYGGDAATSGFGLCLSGLPRGAATRRHGAS